MTKFERLQKSTELSKERLNSVLNECLNSWRKHRRYATILNLLSRKELTTEQQNNIYDFITDYIVDYCC